MGVCTRLCVERLGLESLEEGDVIITNHPKYGGSHLPDVTLIKPVFAEGVLVGYVANRAHHAEIGCPVPGSLPAHARCLEEEGVVILPTLVVSQGKFLWEKKCEDLFLHCKYPTRSVSANKADIEAGLAALKSGESRLKQLVQLHGRNVIHEYMAKVRGVVSSTIQTLLQRTVEETAGTKVCTFEATEKLDDGSIISVTTSIRASEKTASGKSEQMGIVFDFNMHEGNMNCTLAILHNVISVRGSRRVRAPSE